MAVQCMDDLLKPLSGGMPGRMAVAAAEDKDVLLALKEAMARRMVLPVLIGDPRRIENLAEEIGLELKETELISAGSPEEAVHRCMEEASNNRVQSIMKGLVNTAVFLKAVLDKRYNLRTGRLLSHTALFFPKMYHKPVMVTDAALNLSPSCEEKVDIIRNAVEVMQNLGLETPKVALLAHNETPTDKVPASAEAVKIKAMNTTGEITGCIIDGPLSLDAAISEAACRHKNIVSPVGGDADVLVCPDIISANILYKAMGFLAQAHGAAIITGARVPIVVTSRAEEAKTKLLSISLSLNLR